MMMTKNAFYRAGFVGMIGMPNAGKSSLLNYLVQEKVSIVTPKPQTTRRRVMGIINRGGGRAEEEGGEGTRSDHGDGTVRGMGGGGGQIIFVDAPGVISATRGLNAFLAREAQEVIDQSDVLLAVLSVDERRKENLESILDLMDKSGKPWVACINKVDLVDCRHRAFILRDMIRSRPSYPLVRRIYEMSLVHGNGSAEGEVYRLQADEMIQDLRDLLPPSEGPLYNVDLFTPHTLRDMATEIIREKCFEELHNEVPYQLAIRIQKYEEVRPELTRIYSNILIARSGQKAIVIGQKGGVIRAIGMKARQDLEKLLGHKVFLSLRVVFRKDWYNNMGLMKDLGYLFKENRENKKNTHKIPKIPTSGRERGKGV